MAVVLLVLLSALGFVISAHQPGNKIAWLLHATVVVLLLAGATSPLVESGEPIAPSFWGYIAIVINQGIPLTILYLAFLILFIFPTGRFLTRRWSWPGWLGAFFVPGLLLAVLFSEEIGPLPIEENWGIPNPIGFLPTAVAYNLSTAWFLGIIGLAVGGVVAMIVRYRMSDHLVRTQVNWVLYASVISAVGFIAMPLGLFGDNPTLFGILFLTVIGITPVAITIAITRYKLFEIDRIISRTVGYILVVALLGFIYIVGAIWLPTQLLGEQTPIFVAGSTLAVAALFNPVRKRIVGWVDRRFYRSRYDAEQVVDEFADRLRNELDVDQLTRAWVAAVTETMQPSAIGVWVHDQRADNKP
jgi:hypothetical protein